MQEAKQIKKMNKRNADEGESVKKETEMKGATGHKRK